MRVLLLTEQSVGVFNGAARRDQILLDTLRLEHEVELYEFEYKKKKSDLFATYRKLPSEVAKILSSSRYDKIIVSVMPFSPYYLSYRSLNKNVIYYLCDSLFHICSQRINMKASLLGRIARQKEKRLLSQSKAIYLGEDELKAIPSRLRKNAAIVPFHIKKQENLFNPNGPILFIGDFSFLPNRIALEKVIKIARSSSLDFRLVGPNLPGDFHSRLTNIKYSGRLDRIEDVYSGARALIYPINYGTGIKNKVIEAMSFGIPIIGTAPAFTNLNYQPQFLLGDDLDISPDILGKLQLESFKSQEFVRNELSIEKAAAFLAKVLL